MKYRIFLFISSLLIASCSDVSNDEVKAKDYSAENEAQIQSYIETNNLSTEKTASGLHYIITNKGDGATPTASSNVTVAYKGYYLDGSVFDQSTSDGISIGLNQVIPGWTEGIPLFNEGGSGLLLIPAHLGYGSFNYNGIPGGSVLLFDIELKSVN